MEARDTVHSATAPSQALRVPESILMQGAFLGCPAPSYLKECENG